LTRTFIAGACIAVASIFPAAAATCVDGASLATYLGTGYSCTIGDKIFSNFAYTSSAQGGAVAVVASGVTVDTLGPAGSGGSILNPDIGLQFSALWQANANQLSDATIDFTVTVASGVPMMITDTGLAQLSGVNTSGSASVAEEACGPAPCDPSSGQITVLTLQNGATTQTSKEVVFSPLASISVAKDIGVSGGTDPAGFAQLSRVRDTFSQTAVPEPRAISMLLSLGLIAGLVLRKKFQSARG
jgi:hypothetical protein